MLAGARSLPIEQGGRDGRRGRHGRRVVAHTAPLERRIPVLGGEQAGDSRPGPEGPHVKRGSVGVLAVTPVGGELAVNEPRKPVGDRRVVDAQPLEAPHPQVGDEHVGLGQQVPKDGQPAVGGQVHRDTPLGPVVHLEHRVGGHVTSEQELEDPGRVPADRFDLDHLGSPVGQDPRGSRAGHPHTELYDLHIPHRSRHDSSLLVSDGEADARRIPGSSGDPEAPQIKTKGRYGPGCDPVRVHWQHLPFPDGRGPAP